MIEFVNDPDAGVTVVVDNGRDRFALADWTDVDVFVGRLYDAANRQFGDPEHPMSAPLFFSQNRARAVPRRQAQQRASRE